MICDIFINLFCNMFHGVFGDTFYDVFSDMFSNLFYNMFHDVTHSMTRSVILCSVMCHVTNHSLHLSRMYQPPEESCGGDREPQLPEGLPRLPGLCVGGGGDSGQRPQRLLLSLRPRGF